MGNDMISIVIIAKNEEKYLPRLLNSIINQTYKDFEIIVSDAHSTDSTRKIAREYGCRIVDGGLPSVGRNNGARTAKGELILFLDSDVMMPKHFLELNIKEFNRKNLACATAIYVPISKKFIDKFLYFIYNKFALIMQYALPYAGGFCIFARKSVFDRCGGFDEKMLMCEDHVFIKACLKYGKFRILKSAQIFCDVRRLEKEGRLGLLKKYLYVGGYRIFFGDSYTPLVNYELQGNVKIKKGERI